MNKAWLKNYPADIPEEIQVDSSQTLVDLLETSCRQHGDAPAFSNMNTDLSYNDLDRLSQHFASYLQNELGFSRGDRIAIMMPNLLQYPVALFGILRAGMVVVNVNPMYTARELQHQLADAGTRAIVVVENFAHTLARVMDKVPLEAVITTRVGDCLPPFKRALVNFAVKYIKRLVPDFNLPGAISFNTALADGARQPMAEVAITRDDIAFLQYTGGTTGLAKGAVILHRNIVANITQAQAWIDPWLPQDRQLTIITPLPLYHIFALMANCLVFIQRGGKNVLITDPRDLSGLVKQFQKHQPTAFAGVNTLFNGLINRSDFQALDFSSLRLTLGGGAAVQKAVAEKWQDLTGLPLIEAYGLTEASPAVAVNPLNLESYNGSIGLPLPSTDIALRDDKGHEVASGESGELCVAGPQVALEYWENPEETRQSFSPDGFFHTGDIARMDDQGFLYIVDRKKDMILVSGFNVFPNEIEDALVEHPKINEAACIGVANDKTGEAVKVFIVKDDDSLTADEVIAYCRQQMTAYKVPRQVEFLDRLPKSNIGKVLRRELRDHY